MPNNNVLHVRMDKELREQVTSILTTLGLTESDAIKMFYNQVLLNNGLPFEIKIPDKLIAKQMLSDELKRAEESIKSEGTVPFEEVVKRFGLK